MKLYFLINCLLSWLFLGQVLAQERGYPIIRNYSPNEYEQTPQVFSAVQAANGVMYFGLNGLVMQYDGKTWTTQPIPNNSSIYSLAFDHKGTLFVGATGDFGYLQQAENGKLSYKSLHHLLPNPAFKYTSTWQTVALKDEVFFRTFEGLFKYTPTPTPKVTLYEAPKNSFFGGIIADTVHQKIYAYQQHRGLVLLEKDSLVTVPEGDFFIDKEFYAGIQYHADTLLVVTRNHGLYLFPTQKPCKPIPFIVEGTDFFDNNSIYFAKLLPQQRMAFGSIRKGVLIIDHNKQVLQELNENSLLQNNYTRNLYVDNNGYLWITLNQGIARFDGLLDLTYWNKQTGIRDIVETVCRYKGVMYVGTHQTAYALLGNEIRHIDGLPSGQIWQLLAYQFDNQSHLLAATAKGIYEIKDFKALPISKIYTNAANKIYVSHKNPRRIYSTDNQKLVSFLYENGQWKEEGIWFDLKKDIRGIAEAVDGTVWLGTFRQGLVHVIPNNDDVTQPRKITLYQIEDGLPSLKDLMPLRIKDKMLFGTEFGLYQFNEKTAKFEVFDSLNQYLNNKRQTIFSIQEMPDGKIWVLPLYNQQHDIGYLQPTSNGKYQWIYQALRRIPTMMLRCLYVEESGLVWLGGSEGLYRYDSQKDLHNYQKKYNTFIRKVTLEEDSVVFEGNYPIKENFNLQNIDYQYNTIAFDYSLPFTEGEQRTVYSHYLDGFDKHWSEWSHETRKEYTNLKEGNYTFWVKAKNIYGQESSPTQFRFSIQTPYYRTWWAYSLYAIGVVLVIFLVAKLNAWRIEKENDKLEELVRQRTEEISQQKEEILQQSQFLQTAHDEISIKNQELSLQKEEIETQAENLRQANLQIQETYENIKLLNEIGQEIIAVLDMKLLETTIYQQVNALMPAHSFGIGVFNVTGNCLDFNGSVEKDKLLPYHFEKLDNPNSLAAYCFNYRKPLLINNVATEVHQYVPTIHLVGAAEHGELPQSLIYVPLLLHGKAVGVITAQSFSRNAYSEKDITLLATLASYIVIALDNAKAYKLIKLKNDQITDSIRYAETIQNAFLPTDKLFSQVFKDYFVLSYPKDIVSGDFYWLAQSQQQQRTYNFLAVVDCTGHGVPGALMSMIGNTLLNEIVHQKGIVHPQQILQQLDSTIQAYLQQNETENTDGMDIVLCRFEQHATHTEVVYAGAKRPLYLVQEGVFKEVKATRYSIGGTSIKQKTFEETCLVLPPQSMLYLCSDGFTDQNNVARHRFSVARLSEIVLANAHLSCETQAELLKNAFFEFKAHTEQRDDVTLIGVRV